MAVEIMELFVMKYVVSTLTRVLRRLVTKDHRVVDVAPWVWEHQSVFKPLAVTEGVPVQASVSFSFFGLLIVLYRTCIDEFHGSLYHGNWRALHHHAVF